MRIQAQCLEFKARDWDMGWLQPGVNTKPKKSKLVRQGILNVVVCQGVSGELIELSAGFSNTVCWTSKTIFKLQIA